MYFSAGRQPEQYLADFSLSCQSPIYPGVAHPILRQGRDVAAEALERISLQDVTFARIRDRAKLGTPCSVLRFMGVLTLLLPIIGIGDISIPLRHGSRLRASLTHPVNLMAPPSAGLHRAPCSTRHNTTT